MNTEGSMDKIKRTLRDDLWVVLLDIVAVNLSYYLALVLRAAIDNLGLHGVDGVSRFFAFYYIPKRALLGSSGYSFPYIISEVPAR